MALSVVRIRVRREASARHRRVPIEAVHGAVYLDGGYEGAQSLAIRLFEPSFIDATGPDSRDYKTRLQEVAQERFKQTPTYDVIGSSGPDHDKRFSVRVLIGEDEYAQATGRNKKSAEQKAAALALEALV